MHGLHNVAVVVLAAVCAFHSHVDFPFAVRDFGRIIHDERALRMAVLARAFVLYAVSRKFAVHRIERNALILILPNGLGKSNFLFAFKLLDNVKIIDLFELSVYQLISARIERIGSIIVNAHSVVITCIRKLDKVLNGLRRIVPRKRIGNRIVFSVKGISDRNFGVLGRTACEHTERARAERDNGCKRYNTANFVFHEEPPRFFYFSFSLQFRQAVSRSS